MKTLLHCTYAIILATVLQVSQVSADYYNANGYGNQRNLDESLRNWWDIFSTSYPKYKETTAILTQMQHLFPKLVKLYSIGQSVGRREMWVINIAENVHRERPLLRPMVKFVSSMHGDEVLGRSLCLMLATHLVDRYRRKDSRIVKLLQTTDIHLLFAVNPHGFDDAVEGDCNPNPNVLGRRHKNRVDLNRNSPHQFSVRVPVPEPETVNLKNWITQNPFVLSANFHAGALVASYPFDSLSPSVVERLGGRYRQTGVPSLSPDNAVFLYLAKLYSNNHKEMHRGALGSSGACVSRSFPGGITNGADWYNVQNGMQDFNYVHSNCFEVTFEISCCKYPRASILLKEWDNNYLALLEYLEAAQMGIKGIVKGANSGAQIIIGGIRHAIRVTERGEYWRLLVPGKYKVSIVAPGHKTQVFQNVQVTDTKNPIVINHQFV